VAASGERCRRRGLTLMEVLLVLSLLVIVAAIAWPALARPMAGYRLRHAADVLRAQWIRARNQAITGGQTVQFHYSLGGSGYSLAAGDDAEEAILALADAEAAVDESSATPSSSGSGSLLPKDITFHQVETADDLELPPGATLGADLSQEGAEQPLQFYPDGSTSTARVVLKNQYDRCIEVSLRGLTGVATVGEVFSATEP